MKLSHAKVNLFQIRASMSQGGLRLLHRKPRVFDRPELPFRLDGTSVPVFAEEPWLRAFRRLTQDERVLGWVAFHGEIAGAADRDYDARFLDVLRGYRLAVERLRREVGLSAVAESHVVGHDGKVWMVHPADDVWLALFVDHAADPHLLTDLLPRESGVAGS
ncbi:MAG: hypothetical protein K6T30_09010 [Alicyclobacillus sp.]|nr:hypothetical protein [Alicyclobacillus sp.]